VTAFGSIRCVTAHRSIGRRLLDETAGAGGLISPVVSTAPRRNEKPNPPAVSTPSSTGSSEKCWPSSNGGGRTNEGGRAVGGAVCAAADGVGLSARADAAQRNVVATAAHRVNRMHFGVRPPIV